MVDVDAISSSSDWQEVWPASVGADVDVAALYNGPVRGIRVGKGGTLVCVNGAGVARTLHLLQDGEVFYGQIRGLTASGSTAYAITLLP